MKIVASVATAPFGFLFGFFAHSAITHVSFVWYHVALMTLLTAGNIALALVLWRLVNEVKGMRDGM